MLLNSRIDDLERQVSDLQNKLSHWESRAEHAECYLAKSEELCAESESQLTAAQQRVAELERSRDAWEKHYNEMANKKDAEIQRVAELEKEQSLWELRYRGAYETAEKNLARIAELERLRDHLADTREESRAERDRLTADNARLRELLRECVAIEVALTSERLPEESHPVLVAGGLAVYADGEWLSIQDRPHRLIQWEVQWWAEIPRTLEPPRIKSAIGEHD